MDFFEHQEKARKSSHVLILYFILAVIGIVLAVYALAMILNNYLAGNLKGAGNEISLWHSGVLLASAVGTSSTIFLASAYKTMQLNGGGRVVAHELGGRLIDHNSTDYHEQRLLNLVEEMAIASGVPVPEVYVMDSEDSINAFAAGRTTSDAVIGVTRGCMKLLTRDELQGVIAHEFSHILNGDMRLNMRLIGILFGILFLALIGQVLLRSCSSGRRSRNREGGGAVAAIALAGLGLMAIGYIGIFFANLIKASISRQREYLADASAVQFTRNPDGIGGALMKIGALSHGSTIEHPMARDASHLFFGSAIRSQFATHPPLVDRIKRLLPSWDGRYPKVSLRPITDKNEQSAKNQKKARKSARPNVGVPGIPIPGMLLAGDQIGVQLTEDQAAESMRSVHPEQIQLGHEILELMPQEWIEAAHTEPGAQAISFALLLSQDRQLREAEVAELKNLLDQDTYDFVIKSHTELANLHSAVKLALVDISIPSLRRLSPKEYERYRSIIERLVVSDKVVDLFEFALQKLLCRHLDTYFQMAKPLRIRYRNINELNYEASVLITTLSVFSSQGNDNSNRENAFNSAAEHLIGCGAKEIEFLKPEQCGLVQIREAIEKFEKTTPINKRELLLACSKAVLADGVISSKEAELIRAIADTIGASIPPFVRTAPIV